MSPRQAGILRLHAPWAVEACRTPEAAANAALVELARHVAFEQAGVMVWADGGAEPRLLAAHPPVPQGAGTESSFMPAGSGTLISLSLERGDQQMGFLAFSPRSSDPLDTGALEGAKDIAHRLANTLLRLGAPPVGNPRDDERVAALEARVAELERDNTRLREAKAELESFVHSVSHDLVAPVRTIRAATQGLVDMLRTAGVPAERLRHQAHHADEAAARLRGLVDDLAAYNRMGRMGHQRLPLDLREVVEEALAQLADEVEQTGAQVTVEPALPDALGHHGTLVRAVMNLLMNAFKFVAAGVHPRVRIHGAVDHTRAWLGITDNGIGMQEEHSDRVFRAFERLQGGDTYPGSGLGLAIVHRGVTRLGGQVAVRSSPGHGSTFWIGLPRPVQTGSHATG